MKLFPTGGGIAALCCTLIFIILSVILAKKHSRVKILCIVLTLISAAYLAVGSYTVLKPPFFSAGSACAPSGIQAETVRTYLDKTADAAALQEDLISEAETYRTDTILWKNQSTCTAVHKSAVTDESHIEAVFYTFANAEEAKEMFTANCESESKAFPEKLKAEKHGYTQIQTDMYDALILPYSYDATPFLLPFVDANGKSFTVLIRYENTVITVRESAEKYTQDLVLPNTLFR